MLKQLKSSGRYGTFFLILALVLATSSNALAQATLRRALDFDNDGKTDQVVFRNSTGTWYILKSGGGTVFTSFGNGATDFPAPGDYDGDGKVDIGVQRGSASNGPATFYLLESTAGFVAVQWGLSNDFVVPGDYDGDGKTDVAVVRDNSGGLVWLIRQSSNSALLTVSWGLSASDFQAQGDYDGDGKTDIAVWRDPNGTFYIRKASDGSLVASNWGVTGDFPVAAYDTH